LSYLACSRENKGKYAVIKSFYKAPSVKKYMKPSDSPFWKGIVKVKEELFSRGSFTVDNGEDIKF
jgi:hypothetical protein